MLPDFLGIGAQRAGTTWLDQLLRSHAHIYLPPQRKEIHFFDKHYERGADWYESFFPRQAEGSAYLRFGEITPKYLFDEHTPTRIRRLMPACQFLVILRNPVERAYSQYAFTVRDFGYQKDFATYLNEHPDAIGRSKYHEQLARYFDHFPRENFLTLIFEHTVTDPQSAVVRIAAFLNVPPEGFALASALQKVNASYRVRWQRAFACVRRMGVYLRDHDGDWLVNLVKRTGVGRLFRTAGSVPPLEAATRARLVDILAEDMERLEPLLGADLSFWRQTDNAACDDQEAEPRRGSVAMTNRRGKSNA